MNICRPTEVEALLEALLELAKAVVTARRDGEDVARRLTDGAGRHLWVVSQATGCVSLSIEGAGGAVEVVEVVRCNPNEPEAFGMLLSTVDTDDGHSRH
jgi:hypothetical protein